MAGAAQQDRALEGLAVLQRERLARRDGPSPVVTPLEAARAAGRWASIAARISATCSSSAGAMAHGLAPAHDPVGTARGRAGPPARGRSSVAAGPSRRPARAPGRGSRARRRRPSWPARGARRGSARPRTRGPAGCRRRHRPAHRAMAVPVHAPRSSTCASQRAEPPAAALGPVVDVHLVHDVGQRKLHGAHRPVRHDERGRRDPLRGEDRLPARAAGWPRRPRPRRAPPPRRCPPPAPACRAPPPGAPRTPRATAPARSSTRISSSFEHAVEQHGRWRTPSPRAPMWASTRAPRRAKCRAPSAVTAPVRHSVIAVASRIARGTPVRGSYRVSSASSDGSPSPSQIRRSYLSATPDRPASTGTTVGDGLADMAARRRRSMRRCQAPARRRKARKGRRSGAVGAGSSGGASAAGFMAPAGFAAAVAVPAA